MSNDYSSLLLHQAIEKAIDDFAAGDSHMFEAMTDIDDELIDPLDIVYRDHFSHCHDWFPDDLQD